MLKSINIQVANLQKKTGRNPEKQKQMLTQINKLKMERLELKQLVNTYKSGQNST